MEKRGAAFARLFEAVHEGVYIGTIGPDATSTIAANPHLKLMFGYGSETSERDVRPFDLERFVDPQARAALLERLTTDGAVANYLLRLRRADQAAVWVELTGHADRPVDDGSVRIEALIRDVSERKKLDDETRDLYHQLLQAEKMAALGQTISGVAHELNNPLATIVSWAERLSERKLEPSVRRGIETILSESERAARIVRSLLTFARKRQTTRAMVDVNQVLRETLALRAYEQRVTNIAVIVALAAGLPQVFADGQQVQQVLLNLIINAEQAMLSANGRGVLVVRTWHDPHQESVILEINDDGPGIPDDLQPKIFDPFFTTKDVGQGTGLGLTVAYAIVQEHGGRIRLESHASAGASFYVELPITGSKLSPVPIVSGGKTRADTTAGASILVVEDEAALAAAVTDALHDAGYVVERAADGEEALAQIRGQQFDLVICDLKMPRLDGQSFYRTLEEANPELAHRVIFVTGDVVGTEAETFLKESGCRFLAKPFRLGDLLQAVRDGLS
uniref:histidine kinase n=1 Tax=uncultured bacterium lac121 TaxID=1447236 RepID=X2LJJ5_9BACT|nr:nitrogen specific signal transduction histidine kinase [uncultured bacterium lac121]